MPNCLAIDFSSPSPVVVLQLILLAAHASLLIYAHNEKIKELDGVHKRLDHIFADRLRPTYDPAQQVPQPPVVNQPPPPGYRGY